LKALLKKTIKKIVKFLLFGQASYFTYYLGLKYWLWVNMPIGLQTPIGNFILFTLLGTLILDWIISLAFIIFW